MAQRPALTKVAMQEEIQRGEALAAPKNLRIFLQKLIEHDPRQLMVVEKEIVLKGADADLTKLPILRHQELDAGKYVTSAVSILRDPKTGVQNAGIYRAQFHDKHELGFMTGAYQGGSYIFHEHRERKQPM